MNIVESLMDDHTAARTLMARIATTAPDEREELFRELVAVLARHEAAEETILWPVVRAELTGGSGMADRRIAEEQEAEELLAEMEHMDPTTDEFLARFAQLRQDVERHASREEHQVFPELTAHLPPPRLRELGERLERIKAIGPTHPHPHAPNTPPGVTAAGPIAGAFDRARDAIRDLIG